MSADRILEAPVEQTVADIAARHRIDCPVLDRDGMTSSGIEDVPLDVSHERRYADRSGPVTRPGSRVTYCVPFQGDPEVFHLRSSTVTVSPLAADVRNGEVCVTYHERAVESPEEVARLTARADDLFSRIDGLLGSAAADIESANERMEAGVRTQLEARRSKILRERELEQHLGVPLTRSGPTARRLAIEIPRRPAFETPLKRQASGPYVPEPSLTDGQFEALLGDLHRICRALEAMSGLLASLDEEQVRDAVALSLNTAYGEVGREQFRRRGKTDLHVPAGDGDAFIAELKQWKGAAACTRALDQLFGYVTWRDTHTALLLIIRNKDVTAAVASAMDAIRAHPLYLRDGPVVSGVPTFMLHKEGDPDREVRLALLHAAEHA